MARHGERPGERCEADAREVCARGAREVRTCTRATTAFISADTLGQSVGAPTTAPTKRTCPLWKPRHGLPASSLPKENSHLLPVGARKTGSQSEGWADGQRLVARATDYGIQSVAARG